MLTHLQKSQDSDPEVTDPLTPAARKALDRVERICYSPAEAAAALGCTRQTVYALIDAGRVRRFKVGRLTRIPVGDVHALVGGRHATT